LPCPARSERGAAFPPPTRAAVRDLIEEFVADYNAGDLAGLNGHFADEADFRWYFVDGERERDATERHTLLPYFAERHALDDRLRIVDLAIGRKVGWHGGFDFSARLNRRSAEDRARGMWHGKGAADCAMFVWSVGWD
jgi:hypothetical protein